MSGAPERMAITYGDRRITFTVKHTEVRPAHVRITVDPGASVAVTAPPDASPREIRAAVRRRASWICRHHGPVARGSSPWVPGMTVRYLGRRYKLKLVSGPDAEVKLAGSELRVRVPNRDAGLIDNLITGWYRSSAKRYFTRRLDALFSPRLDGGETPPGFQVRRMRRQWGSCSPSGALMLNLDLIKAPRECVDYVIVHELCHRRHHDHGAGFQRLLSRRMPDWEERKAWLELVAHEILG